MKPLLKIGLDLDQTIFDFCGEYIKRFGDFSDDVKITRNVFSLRNDRDFWENLPIINVPDFVPALYCTKRVNRKSFTKNSITKHNLPKAPVYQCNGYCVPKAPYVKGRIDVFIDDSPSNVMELNNAGVPCLLIDTPWNREYVTPLRIYSLKYAEIEYAYITIFNKR